MCGIAGIIGKDRDRVRDAVQRMTDALAHRGPDADGVEVHPFGSCWIGIGHRRLSILDLSPLGRQPMLHEPSGSRIIFNGEIYNFQSLREGLRKEGETFRSGSDTEALLAGVARHGPEYVKRLQGMYAFAEYDPRGPRLILSRDPAGIKPLYVAKAGGCFLFASEVRGILASGLVPRSVSRPAVAGLLAYGAVQQPLTLFESIRMNPPGSWQVIQAEGDDWKAEAPRIWWTPPEAETPPPEAETVQATAKLLDDAVRDHLIADVPVGVFLSAGLDSAVIAGLAARHSKDVRCFTVGFDDQPDFDELGVAGETAKRLGLPHTPIKIPPAAAEAAAAEWFAAADQPSMDGLNTFVISKAVRAHGVKVALCGLGADELFGGYASFHDVPKLRRLSKSVRWLPAGARRGVAGALAIHKSPLVRGKLADMLGSPGDVASLALQRRRALGNRQMANLGFDRANLGLTEDFLPPEAAAWLPGTGVDEGWAVSAIETRFYMTNVLLRDSDANGMAHSIEIRVPFLDQRLLEGMNRLPGSARFPAGKPPKHLLREAAKDVLYPELLARPKTGFALPLRRWMMGPLRPACEAGLLTLKDSRLMEPAGVDAVWNAFTSDPESQAWSRALTLAALGDYLRRHGG